MNFFNTPFPSSPRPPQTPQFDPIKFQQGAQSLDKNTLAQLVQQARAQGIPDSQIESGLNYILSLK